MHFTKSQIAEIAERLALQTKKDSEFKDAIIPLDGEERLPIIQYIPLVQDFENRLLSFAQLRSLVLGNIDMESVGCFLTVNCSTAGAVIRVNGHILYSPYRYAGYYGDVVSVQISADGYDTYYESVTLTHDHTLSVALNKRGGDYDEAIADIYSILDSISLVDNGTHYTLNVKGTSIDLYTKQQIDSIIESGGGSGGGGGEVPPESSDDAYLHFSESAITISASGEVNNSVDVRTNIPWIITGVEMPVEEQDEQVPEESTAVNIYPQIINTEVGGTVQIVIK